MDEFVCKHQEGFDYGLNLPEGEMTGVNFLYSPKIFEYLKMTTHWNHIDLDNSASPRADVIDNLDWNV